MPAGPAGLGMEGGQPQASRKEPLPGCRAGPREERRTQRPEVGKEPAFVDGLRSQERPWSVLWLETCGRRPIWAGRKGGWTEGQREGLAARTGPGGLGREPQETEAERGG